MDLSFHRFDRAAELVVWPGDFAVLMIGAVARQGSSPTACLQMAIGAAAAIVQAADAADEPARFAPQDGAFHGVVAASLARWKEGPACRREE